MFLSSDEGGTEFIRARWDVLLTHDQQSFTGSGQYLEVEGNLLAVQMNPETDEPILAELEGKGGVPARLEVQHESGLGRRFHSDYLRGEFEHGELRRTFIPQRVKMVEYMTFDPGFITREMCADEGHVHFDAAGDVAEAQLLGGVDFIERGAQARGDKLNFEGGDTMTTRLEGRPAAFTADQGTLESPLITRDHALGEIRAVDGVRAEMLAAGEQDGDMPGGGEGPLQVTSEQAVWTETEASFAFEGSVRAWQGESFLTAQELRGWQNEDLITRQRRRAQQPAAATAAGRRGRGSRSRRRTGQRPSALRFRSPAGPWTTNRRSSC